MHQEREGLAPSRHTTSEAGLREAVERELEELLGPEETHEVPVVAGSAAAYASVSPYTEVQASALVKAMTLWMGGVFVVAYMILPTFAEGLGLMSGLLTALPANVIGFAFTLMLAVMAVLAVRPRVRVRRDGKPLLHADPIIAATSGSLAVWGVLHNLVPGLRPFAEFTSTELATFISMNVVESALFGMMLASFARTQGQAFGLGALFQFVFMGVCVFLLL